MDRLKKLKYKYHIALILFLPLLFYLCTSNNKKDVETKKIRTNNKLVALTGFNAYSYFIYKGAPMGYEFELLSLFAKHIGVELEIKVVKNMNKIISKLEKGYGDIIAANLTVTRERLERVNFTEYNILTTQVLIQRKPDGWENMKSVREIEKHLIRNPLDLIGKKIHVRKNSSFYTRLQSLSDEIGGDIEIMEAPGDFETELLISLVARGDIDYTIADENVAKVNLHYFPNIDASTEISLPQQIAWAVNKKSPDLLDALNEWILEFRRTKLYAVIYHKYFKNHRIQTQRVESDYFAVSTGKISKYDHIIKMYSYDINWDWRLIASLVYQESNFNPDALSWAGAFGLMQLMPTTASLYGVDSMSTVAQNVKAGTKHIRWLDNYWVNIIPDERERIKFVLASYNVGLGHVIDARNLAIKYSKNPNVWDNNVDNFLLKKSRERYYNDEVVKHGYCRGEEPYRYVREILSRYHHYKNVIS
ncbi:MAG: transporter substrate-binding domain-containing protein [Bacteroidetes bacterium]|nr:transporter substrate-binding domain-containing protein [Bacteroidota bacterium]